MPKPSPFLEHWYAALRQPVGYVFKIVEGTRQQAVAKLYAVRAAFKDPQLDQLSIVLSPEAEDELWIIHKEPKNADPEGD